MARPAGYRLSASAYRDLRDARHLSPTEVAGRADIRLSTLSGLVAGKHGASITVARRLAEALNCEPATLFPELIGTAAEGVAPTEAVPA